MKNFSELTVIKPTLTLKLVLELEAVGVCPCQLKINDSLEFYGDLVGKNMFIKHLPLTEPISIQLTVNRQHPQAVDIKGIFIDDYEVLPKYQHLAEPPTNYVDFNGIWILEIPNFYPWYHKITGQGWIA